MKNEEAVMAAILKEAAKDTYSGNPNFCAADSGNYDDTYSQGTDDGAIWFAKSLLALMEE